MGYQLSLAQVHIQECCNTKISVDSAGEDSTKWIGDRERAHLSSLLRILLLPAFSYRK